MRSKLQRTASPCNFSAPSFAPSHSLKRATHFADAQAPTRHRALSWLVAHHTPHTTHHTPHTRIKGGWRKCKLGQVPREKLDIAAGHCMLRGVQVIGPRLLLLCARLPLGLEQLGLTRSEQKLTLPRCPLLARFVCEPFRKLPEPVSYVVCCLCASQRQSVCVRWLVECSLTAANAPRYTPKRKGGSRKGTPWAWGV